jgi:hypothetical protein
MIKNGNAYEFLCRYGLDPRGLLNGQNRVKTLLLSSITSFQDKGIMKNEKNQYVPIQQKRNEEKRARLIPKRRTIIKSTNNWYCYAATVCIMSK